MAYTPELIQRFSEFPENEGKEEALLQASRELEETYGEGFMVPAAVVEEKLTEHDCADLIPLLHSSVMRLLGM